MLLLRLLLCCAIAAFAVGLGALAGGAGLQLAGVPVLALCAGLCVAVNWLAFVPSYLARTEHAYDLVGSLTYLAVLGLAVGVALDAGALGWRATLACACAAVWTLRLGSFLFRRVRATGKDGRFDSIKQDAGRFLVAWTLQGLWVFLTSLAVLIMATRGTSESGLLPTDLGFVVWGIGFAVEIVADRQKQAWRRTHPGQFIDQGLWAWCRHPNYFGEIVLWTGLCGVAAGVVTSWQWLALLSPLFVTLLLTRISGIPLLQARAKARWGDDPAWQAYMARTPALIPRPPPR